MKSSSTPPSSSCAVRSVSSVRGSLRAPWRGEAVGGIVPAAAFANQVLVQPARGRQQARQAAAGKALLVQAGDEQAQVAHLQRRPFVDRGFLAQRGEPRQVAAVAVKRVHGHLALAAQVFQIGFQIGFERHAESSQ